MLNQPSLKVSKHSSLSRVLHNNLTHILYLLLALESIPKLGRRKILVNGKPCGKIKYNVHLQEKKNN